MVKELRLGNLLILPFRRAQAKRTDGDRKLSEIILEMGLSLFKVPESLVPQPAKETAVLLATAAWNSALGDQAFRDQHRKAVVQIEWGDSRLWSDLASTDTDSLIAGLVEYKQSQYPDDRRRIVGVELTSEGNFRVHHVCEDNLVIAAFGSVKSPAAPAAPAVAAGGAPIAKKLVARMKRQASRKIVDLKAVVAGRHAAEDFQATVASRDDLADLNPAHAVYVYTQNQVSVVSEQITALDEMAPFVDIVARAEDLYMPSGPPMSPLTMSYFTCWAFFDACVGPANETIGTTIMRIGAAFDMNTELLRLVGLMQESRMSLYVNEGKAGGRVILRDFVTGAVCRAISPAGYLGRKGELWYARVLPPPAPGGLEHVVFTTPYLVLKPGQREWQAYFRRTIPDAPNQGRLDAYERHMKYGPTREYWNDYVFEGYVNHRKDVIYLAGLPDVPESRPNSEVNS